MVVARAVADTLSKIDPPRADAYRANGETLVTRLEALDRQLAAELAPKIRVNCLAPALTETPLASKFFANPESRETMAKKYPLGRTGMPHDIAAIARFLLSPEAGWITGQVIGVDGGMSSLRK